MAVHHYFEKEAVIARLKTVAGNRTNITTTATVDCAVQELDRVARTQIDMVQDRAWVLYADEDEDIQEQDRVTIEGVAYDVLEVTKKDYMGSQNMHLEVIIIEHEDDEDE